MIKKKKKKKKKKKILQYPLFSTWNFWNKIIIFMSSNQKFGERIIFSPDPFGVNIDLSLTVSCEPDTSWSAWFQFKWKGENDLRKYFMINLHEWMLLAQPDLTTSWIRIQLRPAHDYSTSKIIRLKLLVCRPLWLSWMRVWLVIRRLRVLIPAGSPAFFCGNLIMKYFLRGFSPFRWFKKGCFQFLVKECAQYWLTA